MLRRHLHACALAHVVVAPVFAVDVDDDGLPRLVGHGGAGLIDQLRLHAVQHAGELAVLTAVSQHEAGVGFVGAVLKERVVKAALAVLAIRLDVQALLRHVQRVLAHDAERHALADLLHAVVVIVLHPAAKPVLLAVGRVLEPRRGLVDVHLRAVGEHAVFLVPQVVRIGRDADDGHRVVNGDEVGLGDDLRGLHAVAERAGTHDGVGADLDGTGVERGGFRRVRAVERVAHLGVRRNGDRQRAVALKRALVQSAGDVERGLFRKAGEAAHVLFARGGRGVVEQSRLAERAAVGDIVVELGDDHLVKDFAGRGGEADGLARLGQVVVRKIINAVLGRLRGVAVDDQIAVVFERDVRKLPFARLFDVVGQAVTLEVDGLSAHVVDLDVVVRVFDVGSDDALVAGHDFRDVQARGVGQAQTRVHGHLARARVGQARRRLGEALEAAHALLVAAPGGIRLEQVVGDQIDHAALNVREDDGLAVGAQLEAGVRPAGAVRPLVLARGEDDVVAARLDDRALREAPLDQGIRVVAQRVIRQVDGLA